MKTKLTSSAFFVIAAFCLAAFFISCPSPDSDPGSESKPSGPDKTALQSAINQASILVSLTVQESEDGAGLANGVQFAPKADCDAFKAAIASAQSVYNNPNATQAEVDAAVSALATARAIFDASVITVGAPVNKASLAAALVEAKALLAAVKESDDGAGLSPGEDYAPQTARNAFSAAITAAETVSNNSNATQVQVNAALKALKDAQTDFDEATSTVPGGGPVDKTSLGAAISAAETLKATVEIASSGDGLGAGVKYAPQSAHNAFLIAINSAKTTFNNEEATHSLVNVAVSSLATATAAFNNATRTATGGSSPQWTFADPIVNTYGVAWTDYATNGNQLMNTDAELPSNGLILALNASSMNRTMRWMPTQASPGAGFSAGAIQLGGAAVSGFATIAQVQGPFEITVNYVSGGSGSGRYFILKRAGNPDINGLGSTSGTDTVSFKYQYNGTDKVNLTLAANDGIRVHDVIITYNEGVYPAVTEVTLNEVESYLRVGETLQLTPTVLPADARQSVTWISDKPNFATVNNGLVTAVAEGTATITATAADKKEDGTDATATCVIHVIDMANWVYVSSVTVESTKTIVKGEAATLTAQVLPNTASDPLVTWSSDTAAVATVDADGVVTAKNRGTAIITVTTVGEKEEGGTASATCTVTVTDASPLVPLEWHFNANPAGWTQGNVESQPFQADYGNGLTLLGPTGNTDALASDSGTGIDMGVYPTEAALAGELFTIGMLRLNGGDGGTWGKISGFTGPYVLAICYSAPNSTAADRWPAVKIGTSTYNYDGTVSTTNGYSPQVLTVVYSGTDSDDIFLKAKGGIRVHDVYLIPGEPVTDVSLDITTKSLTVEDGPFTLTPTVTPSTAWQGVSWATSNSGTATVANGVVTPVLTGKTAITAASVGLKADGTRAKATCDVTVASSGAWTAVHWNFQTNPDGWTAGDSTTAQPTDADYGNGLTLLSKTGNETGLTTDSGTQHRMGIAVANSIPGSSTGIDTTLFTVGSLRVQGNANTSSTGGTWGKISPDIYDRPFKLTICYNTGSSGSARYPVVKIGSTLYNDDGKTSDPTDSARSPGVLVVTYNYTDAPLIYLKANAGIRVYDIYIEPLE